MSSVRVSPALMAELTAAAPGRVVRKLDKKPELARDWTWTDGENLEVVTDKGERVTVAGPVARDAEAVDCTCLLSPKCLHLLAVLRLLELDDGSSASDEPVEAQERNAAEPDEGADPALTPAQQGAALALWEAGAAVLTHGLHNTGAVVQADLLRAVHTCRGEGLHRGAAAGLRVVEHARQLRGRSDAFDLAAATADLRETLTVARALGFGEPGPRLRELVGVGRRRYVPVPVRRLTGVCTAPVVTRSGFGGVVTWFVDADGELWTLPHIMPAGTPGLTSGPGGAYDAPADLGELLTPHRELCRAALLLSGATGSADRRLGRGKSVQAALSRAGDPVGIAAGEALVEAVVTVVGVQGPALVVARESDGLLIRLLAPTDVAGVHYRHNLSLLARAPGLSLSAVFEPTSARRPSAIAYAVRTDALTVPSAWAGLVNLGLDELQPSYFESLRDHAATVQSAIPFDPVAEARRRLARAVVGGTRTLQAEAQDEIARDCHRLASRMMRSGAGALQGLAAAATGGDQSLTGRRQRADSLALAEAWLAAASWCAGADASLRRAAWDGLSP